MPDLDFTGLKATYVNCTLKKSPEPSHTQGLVDASAGIMRKHGVEVSEIRFVDHDIATGVYPDMREHGWDTDAWPELFGRVLAADILVIAGPIWLGDNSARPRRSSKGSTPTPVSSTTAASGSTTARSAAA